MERDNNSEWKQQQDEHQQYDEQTKLELNAMSDAEFFSWLGSIEEVVKNVSL